MPPKSFPEFLKSTHLLIQKAGIESSREQSSEVGQQRQRGSHQEGADPIFQPFIESRRNDENRTKDRMGWKESSLEAKPETSTGAGCLSSEWPQECSE